MFLNEIFALGNNRALKGDVNFSWLIILPVLFKLHNEVMTAREVLVGGYL
jgi:hypothetical protein